jgi:cell division protein FtsQ
LSPPTAPPEAPEAPPVAIDPRIRARRIEVRRDAGRRRLRRLVWLAGGLGVLVLGVGATRSPLLDVDRVAVLGADSTGPAAVVAASGVTPGDRLVGVPLGEVAERVRRLPWVASATVARSWPGTVRITVVERVPVAALAATQGGSVLLDREGRQLAVVPEVPAGLARLEAAPVDAVPGEAAPAAVADALAVAASVPATVVDLLVAVGPAPDGPGQVDATVRLPDGATARLRMGAPDQLERKWLALLGLFDEVDLRRVTTIDLRVPNAPALTRR